MSENHEGWNLMVERGPDCLLVRFVGRITLRRGDLPLAEHLWNIMQRHFTHRLVLDFSGAERLTGYVVRQLIVLGARICDHEGLMRICGLSEYDQGMFRRYELRRHRLSSYGDRAEALLGLSRVRCLQSNPTADARAVEWL